MNAEYGGDEVDCKFDEMLLYEYLDDLLENEEKLMVSNHLSSCPECRRNINSDYQTDTNLHIITRRIIRVK